MKPEDNDADAIVRICSYHRLNLDLAMIRSRPYVTEAVRNSLQTAFEISPASEHGGFGCLPEELMRMIYDHLDILSYFRFRRVSRYTRYRLTLPPEYQLVTKYALEGLRGLLRTGCADRFTIPDLHRVLITQNCAICGKFGSFLCLLSATRCCITCLRDSRKLRVVSTTDFARGAGISTHQLKVSYGSTLRTLPGQYLTLGGRLRRPKKLILKQEAIIALISQNILKNYSSDFLFSRGKTDEQRFMATTTLPWYDTSSDKVEHGINCKGCDAALVNSKGFPATRKRGGDFERAFSTAEFLSHFESCAEARSIWAERKEGTVPVVGSVPPLGGGYLC